MYLIKLLGSILLAVIFTPSANAQINFHFTQSNMGQGPVYIDNQSIEYISVLSVAPTISIRTTDNYFKKGTSTTTLNANLVRARVIGTGGQLLNLLSVDAAQEATLTTGLTPIYSSLLGLLSGGMVNIRYTIPNPSSFAWKAGEYTNNLNFSLSGIALGSISVKANIINITVDPFLKVSQPQNVEFTINSLDFYRNRTLDAKTQNLSITGTLNAGIRMKTSTPYFTYSNGYQGGTDPRAPATVVMSQMMTPTVKPGEFLAGTTLKLITEAKGIEVPVGNTSRVSMSYSLSKEALKSNFLKKGTYSLNLNHEIFDAESSGTSSNQALSSTILVNVEDMGELIINNQDITLKFETANDYKNGVYVDIPAHLSLSATSPYDVFVKASSTSLSNGSNSIPVGAMQISAGSGGSSEFTPLILKDTRQRVLGISPVIDKKMNIRYSISASEAVKLIGKASGAYTTSITYSLIAP